MRITCVCGRQLPLEHRPPGEPVQCPACGYTFAGPGQAPLMRAVPVGEERAAPKDGPTYDLAPDPSSAAPGPRPRRRRSPVREEAEPPRRRRHLPSLEFGSVFTCIAGWLGHPYAFGAAFLAAVLGVVLVGTAFNELRLASVAADRPQTVTLAQLAANGPGNNAHVVLTDFVLTDDYVYVVRVGRFEGLIRGDDDYSGKPWESVCVPALPPGAAPETPVRVIVYSRGVHSQHELDQFRTRKQIEGTVINSLGSLDSKTAELLRTSYPSTDFSRCLILEEGRKPASPSTSLLRVASGTFLAVVGCLLLLIRWVYRHEV